MANLRPVPPPRGDEAELFREFNDALMLTVAQNVRTDSAQTVEDAVAYAWEQFMVLQPERDNNWRGWLFRAAQRHAWLLERQRREHVAIREEQRDRAESAVESPHVAIELQHDVREALAMVKQLPPRLQRVTLLRALSLKQKEIGELTGDSPTRVHVLVGRANDRLSDLLEERLCQEPAVSPRAERLRELEREQPEWVTNRIGKLPGHKRGHRAESVRRRAWRRAALALDDFRVAMGTDGLPELPTTVPEDPSLRAVVQRALRAVTELQCGRDIGPGFDR